MIAIKDRLTATHVYRFSEFQTGLVESGEKRCTIRLRRDRPTKQGDTLRLTGPTWASGKRHPNPNRLLRVATCIRVDEIELRYSPDGAVKAVLISNALVYDVESFAREDGFKDARLMGAYFRKLHGPGRFWGVFIRW